MQISDDVLSSEQKVLWRTWQEKSRRLDLLADKRMKVFVIAVGLILLGCILYYALRAKASFDPNQQRAAMYEYSSAPLVWLHGHNLERDRARQL